MAEGLRSSHLRNRRHEVAARISAISSLAQVDTDSNVQPPDMGGFFMAKAKTPYAQDERFGRYVGQEADLSMPTPALSRIELTRWCMDAALTLDRWCRELAARGIAVDARARDAAEQLVAALPLYNNDTWCLRDGRMVCSATRDQLLRTLGWPSRAGERLSRAMRLLCLQQAAMHKQRAAARLNMQVDALLAAGEQPLLVLVKQHVPSVHGAVYSYVGAARAAAMTQAEWDASSEDEDAWIYADDSAVEDSAMVVAMAAEPAAEVVSSAVEDSAMVVAMAAEPAANVAAEVVSSAAPATNATAEDTSVSAPQEQPQDDAVYLRFVSRWPYGVGNKAAETLAAWRTRLAQGYEAEAMDAAAAAYNEDRGGTGPSGKSKAVFPLIWLRGEDFKAGVPVSHRGLPDPDAAAMVAAAVERHRVQLVAERSGATAIATVQTPWVTTWFGPVKTPTKTLQVTAALGADATVADAIAPLTAELARMLGDERRRHATA